MTQIPRAEEAIQGNDWIIIDGSKEQETIPAQKPVSESQPHHPNEQWAELPEFWYVGNAWKNKLSSEQKNTIIFEHYLLYCSSADWENTILNCSDEMKNNIINALVIPKLIKEQINLYNDIKK